MKSTTVDSNSANASEHYNDTYFDWQKTSGAFGGWANAKIFRKTVLPTDTVIDFGCGGGFLLKGLDCRTRIGIEPNPAAAKQVVGFGFKHFYSPVEALAQLGEGAADSIVSTNALEHTLDPLQELKNLRPLLKVGGNIHFVVPCDAVSRRYDPADFHRHLFSWSPQNIGNLFDEAGFAVEYARSYVHKWPPRYETFGKLGWPVFNALCRIYGNLERSWFQVELRAKRPS